ncbi:hypothetical protein TNCV_1865161 [Trichonephila clavipes]|nr:hypothetical protein TNCV_1865161 [Trichonephila clavipes]
MGGQIEQRFCPDIWHQSEFFLGALDARSLAWSPAVFIAKFAPNVRPGHQHSLVDAVAFPSYPRHARLERDLAIWRAKKVFDMLNGSKTVLRMSSTYRCAVCVPLMTIKGVRLQKKDFTPYYNSLLRACVAGNSESRIGTLPWPSLYTSSMFVPNTTKDLPCRAAMHVKSVES